MHNADGRITTKAEHGVQIRLTCRNHIDLRWSTKNIAPIGCRTIFYNLMGDQPAGRAAPECSCPACDLVAAADFFNESA